MGGSVWAVLRLCKPPSGHFSSPSPTMESCIQSSGIDLTNPPKNGLSAIISSSPRHIPPPRRPNATPTPPGFHQHPPLARQPLQTSSLSHQTLACHCRCSRMANQRLPLQQTNPQNSTRRRPDNRPSAPGLRHHDPGPTSQRCRRRWWYCCPQQRHFIPKTICNSYVRQYSCGEGFRGPYGSHCVCV